MQVALRTQESITFHCRHGPEDLRERKATAKAKGSTARNRAVDVRGSCKRGCPCTFVAKKKQPNCSSSSGETSTVWEIRYYCTQHENHPTAEVRLKLRRRCLEWRSFQSLTRVIRNNIFLLCRTPLAPSKRPSLKKLRMRSGACCT